MTTATNQPQQTQVKKNPAREYRQMTASIAISLLSDWVGEDRAKEAAGRISAALSASAASARNPTDFYECTPQSIGRCVAIAALTEIMPGTGSTALAYLIPRRARKKEKPQLQYQLSHRGLNALARRTGQTMIGVPIGVSDEIRVDEDGDVRVINRDIDNPPTSERDLRGVIVLVKEINNGSTICRGWVPVSLINARRETSDSYRYALKNDWASNSDPWHVWYVEMAIKTAMHYAISRGWCVIDDSAAVRAISMDQTQDLFQMSAPQLPRLEPGKSATDQLADQLGVGEEDVPEPGEESQETEETAGEESQEPPDSEPESQEAPELSGEAMQLIASISEAADKKAVDKVVLEAQQLVAAKKLDDAEFAEIKREATAAKKTLKK